MKTLKKTLCLVLAVVLVVGVLILPAAADSATAPKEDAKAKEAFDTLKLYGVVNGLDDKGTPGLDKQLTRAEVAAIVYRIMTGDELGTKLDTFASKADVYTDKIPNWAKGYVGYVTDAGIFGGYEDGSFRANNSVTGDELLKVMLVCIGYGKEGEFIGERWAVNTRTLAEKVGMFDIEYTINLDLSKVILRGDVFKIVMNAVSVPRVSYHNGSYSYYVGDNSRPDVTNSGNNHANTSLIVATATAAAAGAQTQDAWGIPEFKAAVGASLTVQFNNPVQPVVKTVVTAAAVKTSTILYDSFYIEDECDIAKELKLTKDAKIAIWRNGAYVGPDEIHVAEENDTFGEFGCHTLIYENKAADKKIAVNATTTVQCDYIMVQIDTYLAKIDSLAGGDKVGDKNDHTVGDTTTDTATLTYYDKKAGSKAATAEKLDGFKKNDWIVVNVNVGGTAAVAMKDPTPTAKTFVAPVTDANVTAKEISKGAIATTSNTYIGFVSTASKQYLYNTTYCRNDKLEPKNLTDKFVYNVVMDQKGFVLDAVPITNPDSGFGVITKYEAVSFDNGTYNGYVARLTLKLPDKTEVVHDFIKTLDNAANNVWDTKAAVGANNVRDGAFAVGNLVYFEKSNTINGLYKATGVLGVDAAHGVIANPVNDYSTTRIVPNRSDILDSYNSSSTFILGNAATDANFLVDDSTVIFLARYSIDNTTTEPNDYKFVGYDVTDFRSLPEIGVDGQAVAIQGMTTIRRNALTVQAFSVDANGQPVKPAAGEVAKYVVINGGTRVVNKAPTQGVPNVAFIYGNTYFEQVGATYYTYNAFKTDGTATTITVATNNTVGIVDGNGLYSYGQPVNNGTGTAYTEVFSLEGTNLLPGRDYELENGVLTCGARHWTVADGCKVYTVAPTPGYPGKAGDCRELTMGTDAFEWEYYCKRNAWVVTDTYGNVCAVFFDLGTNVPAPSIPETAKAGFNTVSMTLDTQITANRTKLSELAFSYNKGATSSTTGTFGGSITAKVVTIKKMDSDSGLYVDVTANAASTAFISSGVYEVKLQLTIVPGEDGTDDEAIYTFDLATAGNILSLNPAYSGVSIAATGTTAKIAADGTITITLTVS